MRSTNGKEIDKYPLSPSTLIRYIRRIYRVRKAGIKPENLVNLWDKDKLENWVSSRNKK